MKLLFVSLLGLFLFSCASENTRTFPPVVPTIPITEIITTPGTITVLSGNSFDRPWSNPETSIIIDAYEGNSIDWDKMAVDKRTVAVIHRSAMGLKVDTKYSERREIARARGYLWGAYHLGTRADTIAQAELFLSQLKGDKETLMILDLEDTGSTKFMTIDQAIVFMEYVHGKTGKIPVVYANHATVLKLNAKVKNHPLFKKSKLWYARFKDRVTDFPKGIWDNYYMWQFSSEINCTVTGSCLYNIPGTKSDMDINVFYGTPGQLRSQWNN